eukprot:CAMPEP_0168588948 /NCGR_PEP_ID=MMETSP0420-20121227/5751_1 /TAXON_ID=498008 /ORGANISM="Pessonella sp." /LENGTH=399 /DNA_ID=CAMNT_0008624463 /DNA_START=113 /DNA_END=1312 /DNA_ORIENTATION=-
MSSKDSITLFVTNIPLAVKEEMLAELFSKLPGFVTARLRTDKSRKIIGFVEYSSIDDAATAMATLQGYKFTNVVAAGLSIHFSKNSSRQVQSLQAEALASATMRLNQRNSILPNHPPPFINLPTINQRPLIQNDDEAAAESVALNSFGAAQLLNTVDAEPYMPFGYIPSSIPPQSLHVSAAPQDQTPSNTLYVEGLPVDATEREVAHIFRPYAGYVSLRIRRKQSKNVPNQYYLLCFVEFQTISQATVALESLQAYPMDNHDRRGLRLSYSHSRRQPRTETPSVADTALLLNNNTNNNNTDNNNNTNNDNNNNNNDKNNNKATNANDTPATTNADQTSAAQGDSLESVFSHLSLDTSPFNDAISADVIADGRRSAPPPRTNSHSLHANKNGDANDAAHK